jgi:6-phosphofructokinase 1
VPEWPYDLDAVCELLWARHANGTTYSIVVVAEGATPKDGAASVATAHTDQFGHARLGGVAVSLSAEIEERTGYETRYTILGHVQRGGTPTAFDRVLATRFGVAAMDAVRDGRFGEMVALRADEIVLLPFADALQAPRLLDPQLFEVASIFFG